MLEAKDVTDDMVSSYRAELFPYRESEPRGEWHPIAIAAAVNAYLATTPKPAPVLTEVERGAVAELVALAKCHDGAMLGPVKTANALLARTAPSAEPTKYRVGDRVYKPTGYEWPGEVRWVGPLEGSVHYIVARDQEDPDRRRALHIFSEKQIALRDADFTTEGE